jgi:hypothetical protein
MWVGPCVEGARVYITCVGQGRKKGINDGSSVRVVDSDLVEMATTTPPPVIKDPSGQTGRRATLPAMFRVGHARSEPFHDLIASSLVFFLRGAFWVVVLCVALWQHSSRLDRSNLLQGMLAHVWVQKIQAQFYSYFFNSYYYLRGQIQLSIYKLQLWNTI